MAGFSDIIGHEQLIRYFQKSAAGGHYSHAYILAGDDGMGKLSLARAFAMSILCQTHNGCGRCPACKQVLTHNHPDLFEIRRPEDKKVLGVDHLREQIVETVDILPYQAEKKIYIIDEAEFMNEQAQNAILKTIEEPPPYVVVMILSSKPELLLQTIHSRCTMLNLHPVPDEQVTRYLEEKMGVARRQATICAAFSRGNVGKAIALSKSEGFMEIFGTTLQVLKEIFDSPVYTLQSSLKPLKNDAADVFHIMKLWYRDVAVMKSCGNQEKLILKEEADDIMRISRKVSFADLTRIQAAIDEASRRLESNVSFELVVQVLLLSMRERNN